MIRELVEHGLARLELGDEDRAALADELSKLVSSIADKVVEDMVGKEVAASAPAEGVVPATAAAPGRKQAPQRQSRDAASRRSEKVAAETQRDEQT